MDFYILFQIFLKYVCERTFVRLVRLHPYKQLALKQQGKNKLAPEFYGLYQIIQKISPVAYELKLPDKSRIHNVFYVSNLKKILGQHQTT